MPLETSVTTQAGTWAIVVMGGSAADHNNFWQVFLRPAGSGRWKLVTPPGTADNGGIVLADGSGRDVITAFRPSQYLHYTPLTQTTDAGHAWSGLNPLDAPLASTPGSLAVEPLTGRLLALVANGDVKQGTTGGTSWTSLATTRALAATPAGRSCGLRALTSVSYTPAGAPVMAGACSRPGAVGIFTAAGHAWHGVGPVLPAALARRPVTVLRLGTAGNQIAALLAAGTGQHTTLVVARASGNGTSWALSASLRTGGHAVSAASLGPGRAVTVVTTGGHGAELSQGRWRMLPALPTATVTLAPGLNGTIDALAVHRGTLTVWHLTGKQDSWTKEQIISVPIQYGSSG